ncbi:MAG TPA: Gfo/Idh/MocA family oxidoreductase [Roseiarcus sp.]|nr:Gfo/Idh/MocA family oxidoreductase [Roseiarcus sp.]
MTETEAGKAAEPSQDDYALVAKPAAEVEAPDLPYHPPMPCDRTMPIALVGAGGISASHLDAYARYGLNVVAICSRDPQRARARRDAYFPAARVTDDFDTLLRDENVRVLDMTAHADVRLNLMRRALKADKHVLSQKPFVENLDDGRELVDLASRRGLKLAVNQNGRWAPHLAYIREAVYAGLIGEVTGVHVEIRWNHGWIAGTSFEAMDDLILWDFGIHWFDFLASVIGDRARLVHATTARAAGQTARPPLLAQALIAFDGGQASLVFDGSTRYGARDSTVVIGAKGVAASHGPDLGHQAVELFTEAGVARPILAGSWFNDGFAGAMGELLCAIEDDREPLNSARGNLLSLKLCQAALRSVRTAVPEPV